MAAVDVKKRDKDGYIKEELYVKAVLP